MSGLRNPENRRHGALMPVAPSPLPQENPVGPVVPVRVVGAFSQFLPGRDRTFFQRIYSANYPRPIVMGPGPPFPIPIPVIRIKAPAQQVIVIKDVIWQVYQNSGIGMEDVVQTDPTRVAGYFALQFSVGNRNMADFNSNVTVRGTPTFFPGNNPNSGAAAIGGGGTNYPFAGSIVPKGEHFASYARPNETIDATVQVLRYPSFDTRGFTVKLEGWLANENELDNIVDRLTR